MTSFKLVKYIPRIKKKKSGLRKIARKVPIFTSGSGERIIIKSSSFRTRHTKRPTNCIFSESLNQSLLLDFYRRDKCFIERNKKTGYVATLLKEKKNRPYHTISCRCNLSLNTQIYN